MNDEILKAERSKYPRNYLPEDFNPGSWESIEPLLSELKSRPLNTKDDLTRWLSDAGELSAAIGQESSLRYVRLTCQTDNPDLEQQYLDFIQNIIPKIQPEHFELSKNYLASPALSDLPEDRYANLTRSNKNSVELFREENVDLQTQDSILGQQYEKTCGEQTAEFEGKECTIPQITKALEDPNRDRRRSAWLTAVKRQFADRDKLETLYDEMIKTRHQIAVNAGFTNYLEYRFRELGRFDYTPADCEKFHKAIEDEVMPVFRELRKVRREKLGLEKLAPYDTKVDPDGRSALNPFQGSRQLVEGTRKIFNAVDPVFAQDFDILSSNELLDLESRKGKAPGGYQTNLDEARLPFIFMNATGRNQDVFTLLHEGGHAFHALAYRDEPLHDYRNAPIEFCEVASMGMEMMACEHLTAFYSEDDATRARQMHLEDIITILPWIARVDAMQHWVYTNPGHSREERAAKWLELDQRFNDELDWSDFPEWKECSWIVQLHFFTVPLYYIEYGIAQLGALQLWANYRRNPILAVKQYRNALALGNSRPLPELFSTAGLRFAFDKEIMGPLMEELTSQLHGGEEESDEEFEEDGPEE